MELIQNVQSQIISLQHQIKTKSERFDFIIENDLQLTEAKNLFLEIKELKEKLKENIQLAEANSTIQITGDQMSPHLYFSSNPTSAAGTF